MPKRYAAQSGPSPAPTVAVPTHRECLRLFVRSPTGSCSAAGFTAVPETSPTSPGTTRLGRRDRATLEGAARTVLVSRSHLMAGSLADLYADLPEQLAWAHAELDTAADRLLGIADDAGDEQAAAVLVSAFAALAA